MFSFIRGFLYNKAENIAIIDCNGIGYEINISQSSFYDLPQLGDEVMLHTYLVVREDDVSLCGFTKLDEKDMFLKLISISGIGAKTALGILSCVNYKDLKTAIYNQDVKFIAKVKGVGKKTAERIIVELKDKFNSQGDFFSQVAVEQVSDEFNQNKLDAIDALVSLGIPKTESTKIVNSVAKAEDKCEEIIAKALKYR